MTRHAAEGLTPVSEVLGHEERIARLEADNAKLWAAIVRASDSGTRCWVALLQTTQLQAAQTAAMTALARRAERLEQTEDNDLRLSEVLGRVEQDVQGLSARLRAMEMGGELS